MPPDREVPERGARALHGKEEFRSRLEFAAAEASENLLERSPDARGVLRHQLVESQNLVPRVFSKVADLFGAPGARLSDLDVAAARAEQLQTPGNERTGERIQHHVESMA